MTPRGRAPCLVMVRVSRMSNTQLNTINLRMMSLGGYIYLLPDFNSNCQYICLNVRFVSDKGCTVNEAPYVFFRRMNYTFLSHVYKHQ